MNLTKEQVKSLALWMQHLNISEEIVLYFRNTFSPKENTEKNEIIKGTMTWGRLVEYLIQDEESNADIKKQILQQIVEKIYDDMKLPLRSKLKMDYDDEESEIKIGDRVRLKGDSNSPEMTVIGNSSQDARYQYAAIGKGVQENTIQNDDILKCAYFVTEEDDETRAKPMQTVEIHKDALKKIITTQPSNKQ